ncbi:hypothetical protein JQ615_06025 [Bradyrhizobium jicamae]|uniref:Transposase n=1 Tax=Bradyrhizobium jicamae TaxID=280332 RepID=A0ABS5FDR9_9BRAD|nr:hypothetical protein [Bradyrhizobium jicamae]MBR0794943.1 hypothetical protein [Bradyrhizobium jicamae]
MQQIVSLSAPDHFDILFGTTEIRHVFSRDCGSARDARGLVDGLIWPKTGFASIV